MRTRPPVPEGALFVRCYFSWRGQEGNKAQDRRDVGREAYYVPRKCVAFFSSLSVKPTNQKGFNNFDRELG